MDRESLFDYSDYKKWVLHSLNKNSRGSRSRLAEACNCHLAYISQVLEGPANFTLEQAAAINKHFGHSEQESDYFLLLVHLARAGTQELKKYYEEKIFKLREFRNQFVSRIKSKKTLSLEDETKYYSSWYYIATYVLISIDSYKTKNALSEKLGISLSKMAEILKFLTDIKMIKKEKDHYEIAETRLHLTSQSPLITNHHTNWRLKSLSSLERLEHDDTHFSGVYSMSKKDMNRIKAKLLELIEEVEPIIRETNPERAYCLAFDFFEV